MKISLSAPEPLTRTIYRKLALLVFAAACILGFAGVCLFAVYEVLSNRDMLEIRAWFVAAKVLVLIMVGVALHKMLSSRVVKLCESLQRYQAEDFRQRLALPNDVLRRPGDELDRLGNAIQAMSEKLSELLTQLAGQESQRRELVANISHDLRAPLASMRAYLETAIAAGAGDVEAAREHMQLSLQHAQRVTRLVDDLFELSKLEARQIDPQWESFLVGDLLQDLAQKYAVQARERGIRLIAQAPQTQPLVLADLSLIERALVNLLDNALRFTPGGGEVRLWLEPHDQRVCIYVRDTGVGIPSDELPLVGRRFFQGQRKQALHPGGSGLGLSIVKGILALHKTQLQIDSQIQTGTTVSFCLPIA